MTTRELSTLEVLYTVDFTVLFCRRRCERVAAVAVAVACAIPRISYGLGDMNVLVTLISLVIHAIKVDMHKDACGCTGRNKILHRPARPGKIADISVQGLLELPVRVWVYGAWLF